MVGKVKNLFPIVLMSLIPTILIWLPFFLRLETFWNIPIPAGGMATIVANFDGPLYIVVAKTLYNLQEIGQNYSFPLPNEYYAAHFPLFPLLIRLFGIIMVFPYAMLTVTAVSSILALYFFNKFIRQYVNRNNALWLTFVFAMFPARWLIVRSVGSPEPLFVTSTIASVYYFQNRKYWGAGIWGALAQATKSAGILLFVAYIIILTLPILKKLATNPKRIINSIEWRALPIALIPLTLLGIFFSYKITFDNFFAYFNSGDNIHLAFPPFQVFNYSAPWVGTFWLEEIIFIYFIGVLGLLQLIKQKKTVLAWFVGVFFTTIIFISHRDVLRYSLPIIPFIFVGFSDFMVKREFKFAVAFILIPIYLFSLAFISQNAMPISDWSPLL